MEDLVNTEKNYVDCLTGIIRVRFDWLILHWSLDADPPTHQQKVAAAWSRSNLPPPELDSMFRAVEGVYKANRNLHTVRIDPFPHL